MLSLKAFFRKLLLIMYIALLWSSLKNAVTSSEKLLSDQVVCVVLRTFGLGFVRLSYVVCSVVVHCTFEI